MPDFLLMFLLTLKNADFVNAAFKRSPQKNTLVAQITPIAFFSQPPSWGLPTSATFFIIFFLI